MTRSQDDCIQTTGIRFLRQPEKPSSDKAPPSSGNAAGRGTGAKLGVSRNLFAVLMVASPLGSAENSGALTWKMERFMPTSKQQSI